MNQNIKYGSDDRGRVWRASPEFLNPDQTVLQVMYPDNNPQWSNWDILDDEGMIEITNREGILWLKDVIEA